MGRGIESRRIRLLQMLTNFHIGGTERQVANLALGIDSSHFDLHIACLRNSGELLAELETLEVPRPEFRIGPLYSPKTFWQGIRLARYVRRNLIQIVHSYGFYPNVFTVPVARIAGASIVVASIRDTGDLLTPLQRRLLKMVCRLADCVLVNAEAIRESLIRQGYDPNHIVVIRNGITVPRSERKRRGALLRRELGLPLSARLVGVFSRLNRMKGVDYFLDAAAMVAAESPDVCFLVVGDGVIRTELEDQARRLGLDRRIGFAGFRNDVPDLLSEAAVSVLPSLSEGISNTLLESMAAGTPVIATRVGGNPEVVEDEVSGLLVPPRDSAALAAAMSRLLADRELAIRLGRAGAQRVSDLFSIEHSVHQTEELYQQLIDAKGHL
ncbi:MAG TPA: glycosyltransferase [Bryobacteraceae bacterium]|nr:glycosyltransferase [Bryobacteraceae bacterium]